MASPPRHFVRLLIVGLGGCATTVTPPANVQRPVAIALLDHGRTSSLVLPAPGNDTVMMRYAYGDWKWFALDQTDLLTGIAALLWPTLATLARQVMTGTVNEPQIRSGVPYLIEHFHSITVERGACEQLWSDLERQFHSEIQTRIDDPTSGFSFVHHPRSYTLLHNSNHATARWLRQAGCKVSGLAVNSDWRITQQEQATAHVSPLGK
jgi:hypothetical protein